MIGGSRIAITAGRKESEAAHVEDAVVRAESAPGDSIAEDSISEGSISEGSISEGSISEGSGSASSDASRSATLIYNPKAGGGGGPEPETLQEMLSEAGYEPSYRATEAPEELDAIFRESQGLIVVAGGDGTFREVVRRLYGKERPVTLLPLGTANNAARSLGIQGSLGQVVAGLQQPQKVHLDVAKARGPWGEEFVLEGAGLGMFANILSAYRPDVGKSLVRAVTAAVNTFGDNPVRCRVELDGERMDGEYLLLEVMNMRAIGPRLQLAPDADPTDGLLDVVLVKYENRDAWLAYFRGLMTSGLSDLPSVEVKRGRKLKVNWRASAFHVDGQTLCEDARESETKTFSALIEVIPGALEVWLPSSTEGQ
ncbi:MAG: diacylglycerol kinase family protein [Trueperaceae bacterium]